ILAEVYKLNTGSELAVSVLSQAENSADFKLPPEPLNVDALEQYLGIYAAEDGPILEVFLQDNDLWVRHRGPLPDRLRWLGANDFYALGTERIHYQFKTEAGGKVVSLTRESDLGTVTA